MKSLFIVVLGAWLLTLVLAQSAEHLLEVQKTVEPESLNGVYTIKVSYRATPSAKNISDITIIDSLPNSLELVSGQLVRKVSSPTSDWSHNSYQVKAIGVDLSLHKKSASIELPPAEISFTAGNSVNVLTVRTAPQTLTVTLALPEGYIHLSPLICFVTLILPVAVAVYAIPYFRTQALKKKKAKKY